MEETICKMEEVRCKMDDEKEALDKAFFVDCMKSVVRKMQRQEEMIQLLVDDLKMRNHEGVLYLRGERMYSTQELIDGLGVCRRTIHRYRKDGELPYIILRNAAYYKESDVLEIIKRYANTLDKKTIEAFMAGMKTKNGDFIATK